MAKLLQGTIITFNDGTSGKVIKELGSGGQGTVYMIERNGDKFALKWYHKCPSITMMDNMKANISMGSPSEEFLWPITDTIQSYGSYGYLMKLVPQSFKGYTKYILGGASSVICSTEEVQINAAINICSSFQKLHLKGLSYQDLNDGNFFIDPTDGNVLIGDNDNAAPDKTNISNIRGKCRYMAPEVVIGQDPDKFSDYFSLAVILFKFFFLDHPLEGEYNQKCPCLTETFERKLYGENPVFIFDPNDKSNQATPRNKNAIKRWPKAPKILRDAFVKAFSREAMHNPKTRLSERDWIKVLTEYRSTLCKCPICDQLTYIEQDDFGKCKECGGKRNLHWIAIGKTNIPIAINQKIYTFQIENNINYLDIAGIIVPNKIDPRKLGLKNLSHNNWIIKYTNPNSGKSINKAIKHEEVVPILDGMQIDFGKTLGVINLIAYK